MARLMPLVLAATVLLGCSSSPRPSPPPREIEISLYTAPLYVDPRMYSLGANFVAAAPGQRDPPFLAQSANFEFVQYDVPALSQGRVPETPKLRRILDDFVASLEAQGWRRVGQGQSWYSYRFERSGA
ncbi:MAG TPA: hypothetical protein VE684_20720 [Crenalkalicoccus sp.]|nr:hypothetical protein [Crenalkalicoccus sp.]